MKSALMFFAFMIGLPLFFCSALAFAAGVLIVALHFLGDTPPFPNDPYLIALVFLVCPVIVIAGLAIQSRTTRDYYRRKAEEIRKMSEPERGA